MMTPSEREVALTQMGQAIRCFYSAAVQIGNHPFIEFSGVMTAYLKSCQRAHEAGIDFTNCSIHAGNPLPMEGFEVSYLNEKLNCIFDGRITASPEPTTEPKEELTPATYGTLKQAFDAGLAHQCP